MVAAIEACRTQRHSAAFTPSPVRRVARSAGELRLLSLNRLSIVGREVGESVPGRLRWRSGRSRSDSSDPARET
jgi:hypothetical protein